MLTALKHFGIACFAVSGAVALYLLNDSGKATAIFALTILLHQWMFAEL